MSDEFKTSFLGALQAALSVLLIIFYGILAGQFKILENSVTNQISAICVKLFLPALLITSVGSQLHLHNLHQYIPVLSKSFYG